jgi:hypothetical protein
MPSLQTAAPSPAVAPDRRPQIEPSSRCAAWTRLLGGIVVALLSLAGAKPAAAVCVSTAQGFKDQLATWVSSSDKTITIQLVQGTYSLNVDYDQRGPGQNACCDSYGANANIVISGGYTAGCASRVLGPDLTTIDGGGSGRFFLWINGTAKVSNVTFQNFGSSDGVTLFGLVGGAPTLDVDHVIGSGNRTMLFQGGTTSVEDVVVTGQPASAQPALQIVTTDQFATATHLTIVANGGSGLSVANQFGGNLPVSIFNSIFYNNTSGDIVGYDSNDNNNIKVYSSIAVVSSSPASGTYIPPGQLVNVFAADPKFVDGLHLSTAPASLSPAINTGTSAVIGGEPSTDIAGGPRVVGGAPDMGAYESDYSYFKTYTVTTTNDNGSNASPTANSLRAAIVAAKASAAGQLTPKTYLIDFNLPIGSGCPLLLSMNTTAFPDIDFDLTIDGTTQPGWTANTTLTGFDANLCVGINGGDAFANAFNAVAGGRLSVLGMRLGGFTDAAIRLNAGSGHRIFGNQIGNVGVGLLTTHAANHDGVRITGTASASFVGAFDDAATRNMITNNTDVGVYIDSYVSASTPGSYVVNNLIGLGSDGATVVANGSGIFVNGSPRNLIAYNTVAGSTGIGVTLSGANARYNLVQANNIGTPESGSGSALNGSWGVVVNNGANLNTIGAPRSGTSSGNLIASANQGVFISSSGGAANQTLANTFLIDTAAPAPLPIDLGAVGVTANDLFDGDSGPNDLQNFPVILHAFRTAGGYEWIEGDLDTLPNDAFRLDAYLRQCCNAAQALYEYLGRDGSGLSNGFGHVHFWIRVPAPDLNAVPLSSITVTATAANGDTSEMSATVAESADMIFRDDLESHL